MNYYTMTMSRTGEVINEHETRQERDAFCFRHPTAVKISPFCAWSKLCRMQGPNVADMEARLFKRLRRS